MYFYPVRNWGIKSRIVKTRAGDQFSKQVFEPGTVKDIYTRGAQHAETCAGAWIFIYSIYIFPSSIT